MPGGLAREFPGRNGGAAEVRLGPRPGIRRPRWIVGAILLAICGQAVSAPGLIVAPAAADRFVFLAVGRQGYADSATREVALSMERIAAARRDVNAVFLLGDNFFPAGVDSVFDPRWASGFEELYDGPHLRGMRFFAVAGNHDHQGSIEAEVEYARRRAGSGRWVMDGAYYSRDFGAVDGRPLARVVFLDSVSLLGLDADRRSAGFADTQAQQVALLRSAFAPSVAAPYWKVVAAHYPARSRTTNPFSRARVMTKLLPTLKALGVDLYVSANDRFQQVIDVAGEPLHVSVNGGGKKLDDIPPRDDGSVLVAPQRGFGLIAMARGKMTVQLFDAGGQLSRTIARERAER